MSPAPNCPSFALIESQIDRVKARLRSAPVQDIVLVRLIKALSGQLGYHLGRKVRPHGISEVGFRTLTMLYAQLDTGINPSDLSDASGETRTNMTRICDELVRKGLVRRRASTEDRRRIVLELTKKGVDLIEKLLPQVWGGVSEMTAAISKPEKDTLERLLKKLLFAFEAHAEHEK
ncbi:MAG TPA: MarR family transcriptional regulator [Rudaea sp.]|jgi:MarR family transcriptional repressor of emrRAB|nr:MarR family transcriptional regulator [Rudaea sp.]